MKRRIICLLTAALLAVATVGCGSGQDTAKESREEAADMQDEDQVETAVTQEKENQKENVSAQEGESQEATDTAPEDEESANKEDSGDAQKGSAEEEALLSGKHYVNINIRDKGTIKAELDADAAPITVTNFVKLVKEGFYDGLTFHRIIEGFMMQGGDPTGTGMGNAGQTITGEFASNGVENPISHTRGTISMARSGQPDSASCQFFIMHQDGTYLDGDYAAFGHVTEGMEIVDDICENTTGQDSNGMVPEENRPVIESIEYVE